MPRYAGMMSAGNVQTPGFHTLESHKNQRWHETVFSPTAFIGRQPQMTTRFRNRYRHSRRGVIDLLHWVRYGALPGRLQWRSLSQSSGCMSMV